MIFLGFLGFLGLGILEFLGFLGFGDSWVCLFLISFCGFGFQARGIFVLGEVFQRESV